MTKQEARVMMKQKRSVMSEEERRRQEQAVAQRLFTLREWSQVEWFYPFVSYGTELDTLNILKQVLQHPISGRMLRVAVPRVEGREMDFYEIHSMEDLEPGYQGILEPKADCPEVEAREGFMLLPGLAFDREGNRVGYGGGYYDRYLERYGSERLLTVAVAFDYQVVDHIEGEVHDIRPQIILTSQGEMRFIKRDINLRGT